MRSKVKVVAFFAVMLVSAALFWETRGSRVPLRESVFVVLFIIFLFWVIRMTITVVRHEKRLAMIERGIDPDAKR